MKRQALPDAVEHMGRGTQTADKRGDSLWEKRWSMGDRSTSIRQLTTGEEMGPSPSNH